MPHDMERVKSLDANRFHLKHREVWAGAPFDRGVKIAVVPLVAATGNGGVCAWANPEPNAVIVDSVVIDVTTAAVAATTVVVGTAATATTSSANLLDTQSVAAIAQIDNVSNKGTSGKSSGKVAQGGFITATANQAPTGLVGNAYICYFNV